MTYTVDIEVPIIEVIDGWTVNDVNTEDDCDDAFAVLTALVVSIEARMDELAIAGKEMTPDYKRAKAALRWKKAALSVINTKRGQIRRRVQSAEDASRQKRAWKYISAMYPEITKEAFRHIAADTDELVISKSTSEASK